MRPLLVLRPEPGATATARRARARGWRVVSAPLFAIEPVAWAPPPADAYDALVVTSANAVRQAGPALARYGGLPTYAVGAATAAALRAAGFADVTVGGGDAAALADRLRADARSRPLHLAGEDARSLGAEGISTTRVTVYRARAVTALPANAVRALGAGAAALLHSPRAAALFAALAGEVGLARATIPIAAISAAAADAVGEGWHRCAIAAVPDDDALLAAAAALCEECGDGTIWAG